MDILQIIWLAAAEHRFFWQHLEMRLDMQVKWHYRGLFCPERDLGCSSVGNRESQKVFEEFWNFQKIILAKLAGSTYVKEWCFSLSNFLTFIWHDCIGNAHCVTQLVHKPLSSHMSKPNNNHVASWCLLPLYKHKVSKQMKCYIISMLPWYEYSQRKLQVNKTSINEK